MNQEQRSEVKQSVPSTSAEAWGLRNPGLIMSTGGDNEVHEFTGMWALKPDADLAVFTRGLAPGGFVRPPGASFSTMTTQLGLIRTARWFVGTSTDFGGPTLYFVSQFDSSLEKYFDDFVLNGKENLELIWGQCIGCPTGPDTTAHDIVEFVARGQMKTLACYDAFPSLSNGQIQKHADWYEKTRRFQRAVASDEGSLEDVVNAFMEELAKPYPFVPSSAMIDTDASRQWQYGDIPEHVYEMQRPKAA